MLGEVGHGDSLAVRSTTLLLTTFKGRQRGGGVGCWDGGVANGPGNDRCCWRGTWRSSTPAAGQEAQVRSGRFGEVQSIVSTGLGSDLCLKTCASIIDSARSVACGQPLARKFIFTRILFDSVNLPG